MLNLSSSVTPCTVRHGVWSPASGVARRPRQALLFSPDLCKICPLLFSPGRSTRFIHQPNPAISLFLSRTDLSAPSLALHDHAPSQFVRSFVRSLQPYQRPRVCVSTSTFTGACLRSNTRFLRPRVSSFAHASYPAHSTYSLARSLQKFAPRRTLSLRPSTSRPFVLVLARSSIL